MKPLLPCVRRLLRPHWAANLEGYLEAAIAACPGAILFGSWAAKEETFINVDGEYRVVSDIDVSCSTHDALIDTLTARVRRVVPGIRVDCSDVFALGNLNQVRQRLMPPASILSATVDRNEVAEAAAIRVFYSSLDVWTTAQSGDHPGLVYALMRMASEIPLLHCWRAGLICGSYKTRLEVALNETAFSRSSHSLFVLSCVETKRGAFQLSTEPTDGQLYRLLETTAVAFEEAILALDLKRSEYGGTALALLCLLRDSIDINLGVNRASTLSAWKRYRSAIPDGRTREHYLRRRVEVLATRSAHLPPSHSSVATAALVL